MYLDIALNNDIYEFVSDICENSIKNLYDIDVDIIQINEIIVKNEDELAHYVGMDFTGSWYIDTFNHAHFQLSRPYYKYHIIDKLGVNSEELEYFINNINCW